MQNSSIAKVQGQELQIYVDFVSTVTTIRLSDAENLKLKLSENGYPILHVYGGGMVPTIGTTTFQLQIDEVTTEVAAVVVADSV